MGCKLQRLAWDANAEYLTSVLVAVREPLPRGRRCRGEMGTTLQKQKVAIVKKRDQMITDNDEICARKSIEASITSKIGTATRAVLNA